MQRRIFSYCNTFYILFTDPCNGGYVCDSNVGIVCLYAHQICDSFRHCTDLSDELECGMLLYNVHGCMVHVEIRHFYQQLM